MKKKVSLWTLSLLTAVAFAQDRPETGETPEVPRYTVEIIIFSYDQSVTAGSEIFVPDAPPPEEDIAEADFETAAVRESIPEFVAAEPDELPDDPTKNFELTMLAEEEFTLLNIADHLERLDAYQPLMHFGWTQATHPEEETEARPLSFFVTPPAGLEGDLKLYLSRYLHLAVNLQLAAPIESVPNNPYDRDAYEYPDSQVRSYPVHYRITEDRIFKNGDLRYFDHPKFGVLAKITRAEKAPSDAGIGYETELLGEGQ